MTDDRSTLPPDPAKFDDPRNVAARKRGLNQPYIAGGDDPDLEQTLAKERPYRNLLIAMIIAIIGLGFGLGIVAALILPGT